MPYFRRQYGTQTTLNFELFETDGIDYATVSAVIGDVLYIKDEGTPVTAANTTNAQLFSAIGTSGRQVYRLVVPATALQAMRLVIPVVDQGTKQWLDTSLIVETYGHPSSQHGETTVSAVVSALGVYTAPTSALLATTASSIRQDTSSIRARIPAALVSGRMDSDIRAINGFTGPAASIAVAGSTIVINSAVAGTLSTTQMSTGLSEATDSHYNGRVLIWTSGVLKDQATDITAYDGTNKILTYTATTEAPTAGDDFVIL